MAAELSLTANDLAETSLTLLGNTGYDLLDLGVTPVSPTVEFSGPRGALGRRPTSSSLPNREIRLALRVTASSKDQLATRLESLGDVLRLMHEAGGTMTWRSSSQTYRQHADVLTASVPEVNWTKSAESNVAVDVGVILTAAPYLEGDPMDIEDGFATDTSANYTADNGALSDVTIGSGIVASSANHTTTKRLIQTDRGYSYGDHEATVEAIVSSTINGWAAGVVLKREDSSNYVLAYVDDNGTNTRLRIDVISGGSSVTSSSANASSRVSAGDHVFVRGRIEQGVAYVELWHESNPLERLMEPDERESLNIGDYVAADDEGQAGIYWTPNTSDAELRSFQVRPFSYYAVDERGEKLRGVIPGDAPAKVEAVVRYDQLNSAHVRWGMLAWAKRPRVHSLVSNGAFLSSAPTAVWETGGKGNTAAATSIARWSGDGKYQNASLQVTCAASAGSGVYHDMHYDFRPGVTYTAEAWVRSDSDTDEIEIALGDDDGTVESTTTHTLTSTWTKISVTQTGWDNTDEGVVAIRCTGAGAPVFRMDGVRVYEGTTAPPEAELSEMSIQPVPPFGFRDGLAQPYPDPISLGSAFRGEYEQLDSTIAAGGETESVSFPIGPHLIESDPGADGETILEVWARVLCSSAFTGGVTATVGIANSLSSSPIYYGMEHGSTGKSLVMPDGTNEWVLTRLDTIPIFAGAKRGSMFGALVLTFTIAAGTNLQPFGVDWIALVNPRQRAVTPTGVLLAEHANFRNSISTSFDYNNLVRVSPDLSAVRESTIGRVPNPGMGGAMLEFPPGSVDVLWLSSYAIPDGTDDNVGDTRPYPDLHFGITPRWHLLRPSS